LNAQRKEDNQSPTTMPPTSRQCSDSLG